MPRNSSTALKSHLQTAVKIVTPGDLSCAGPLVTCFLHGQVCSHLLWMHKKCFADPWIFLNNFKPLLPSHHCISAPDWTQTRAGCPGWRSPAQPDPPLAVTSHPWASTVAASKLLHLVSCSPGQFCLNPKTPPIKHLGKDVTAREGQGSVLSQGSGCGHGNRSKLCISALQGNPAPSKVTESFSLPGHWDTHSDELGHTNTRV